MKYLFFQQLEKLSEIPMEAGELESEDEDIKMPTKMSFDRHGDEYDMDNIFSADEEDEENDDEEASEEEAEEK